MPMMHQGRAKLVEELGEVQQINGKMLQYPNQDTHPDDKGSLRQRLFDEMADVAAASEYVFGAMSMTQEEWGDFCDRRDEKLRLFHVWGSEER